MDDPQLDAIYRKVPAVLCQGKCTAACGPIIATRREYDHVTADAPMPEPVDDLTCPLLDDGRCSRYERRPLICRLYGAADGLECPHGCVPLRTLTRAEVHNLLDATARLSEGEQVAFHPMAARILGWLGRE